MKTPVVTLIILGISQWAMAQETGDTWSTSDEFRTRMDQLGNRPPPPAFGKEDAAELKSLSDELSVLRRKLLAPGHQPTAEEIDELSKKAAKLTPRVRELTQRSNDWKHYQEDPTADWTIDPQPEHPTIGPADRNIPAIAAADDGDTEIPDFCRLLMRYEGARLQLSINGSGPPTASTWLQLAQLFSVAAEGRVTFGGETGEEACRLRAAFLQAMSILHASVDQYKSGNTAQARSSWEEGIAHLHQLDTILKAAKRLEGNLDAIERLPPFNPDMIAAFNREGILPDGLLYQVDMNWVGSTGSHAGDATTSGIVRDQLALFCPWGVPVWSYLKRAGMTEGFDLRILRPYGGENWEKLWATGIGPAAIPANVRQHLEDLTAGSFVHRGHLFNLNWEAVEGTGTCTVWFPSPLIRDWTAGDVLGTISSMLTYMKFGLVSTALEFGSMVLGEALDQVSPESWPTQIGIGIASEADAWQFDEFMQLKPNALSGVSLAKGALLKVLDRFESLEMENLFEGINPRDDNVQSQLGHQYTYDGSWMAPVVLRAAVIGFEKVPDNEYRRMWSFTRYWLLDPRGLTGDATPWDLSKLAVEATPGASATLGGDLAAAEKVWWPVPETNQGWGSEARIAAFEPELQIIDVKIKPELAAKWTEDCPDGLGLVGVIRFPPPYEDQIEMSPLEAQGQSLRFAFRNRDVVWPQKTDPQVNWKPRKLFSQYELSIMRAPLTTDANRAIDANNAFAIDSPDALKLADIPVRFVPKPGFPATGKIEHPSDDTVKVTINYTGENARIFDLEPEGGTDSILPVVFRVPDRGGINQLDKLLHLNVTMGPTTVGWHTLRVKVEHPSLAYPKGLVVHEFVERESAVAVFMAKIHVLVGTSRITCQVPGFPPESFLVERAQDSNYEPVDHQDWQRRLQECVQKIQTASNTEYRDYGQLSYVQAKLGYAMACTKAYQFDQARTILTEQIPEEVPNWQRLAQTNMRRYAEQFPEDYFEALADLCYRQGDSLGLAKALPNLMALEKQKIDKKAQEGKYVGDSYYRLSQVWVDSINQLILLDADPALIARLHADWIELRRQSGYFLGQFDHRRFRYLQENY